MPTLQFRMAEDEDVTAVVALVNAAYRGESSRKGWTTEADLLGGQRSDSREIRELLATPGSVIVLGFEQDKLRACLHLQKGGEAESASLGLFAISPEQQGRGLGKQCLAYAEDFVRQRWSASSIRMTVISLRNELIAYYRRSGYQLTGEVEPFPMGDERFGIPKVDALEFVVLEKSLPGLTESRT